MRLRIVRPLPRQIEGFDLSFFRFGASYDLKPPLSDLLLVDGYGVPEDEPSAGPVVTPVACQPEASKPARRPAKPTAPKRSATRKKPAR